MLFLHALIAAGSVYIPSPNWESLSHSTNPLQLIERPYYATPVWFVMGIELPMAHAVARKADGGLVLDPNQSTGHVIAYLEDAKGKITNSRISLGPKPGFAIGRANKMEFQSGKIPAVWNFTIQGGFFMYRFKVDSQQLEACRVAFAKKRNNPGEYSPNNHCTTSVIEIAQKCGIHLPDGVSDVEISLFHRSRKSNPGGLFEQLNKLGVEKTYVFWEKTKWH